MNYTQAQEYIESTNKFGSILGLDTIKNLLKELGNPQDHLSFIHIAGTNGKGSVSAFLSSILSCSGYKTGRYSSPAVFEYLERFQINNQLIDETLFAELTEIIKSAVERMIQNGMVHPTIFEIETALAFLYFYKSHCDIVVLETGLGGALDATNIIRNTVCSVITTISMDHMQFLGNSLEQIAIQKAGIIKPGSPVVSAVQKPEASSVISQAAKDNGSECDFLNAKQISNIVYGYKRQSFYFQDNPYEISLAGKFQIQNAALSILVCNTLNKLGWDISRQNLQQGLLGTRWPGRFMLIHSDPIFILDGAHNEDAAIQLKESIELYFKHKRIIFIMGIFSDKAYQKIISITAPLASEIIAVATPDNQRALPAHLLAKEVAHYHKPPYIAESLSEAVRQAFCLAEDNDIIIAFGSLSYLGDLWRYYCKYTNREDSQIW